MISFFANIFGYILNFIYNFIGNYGLAIIIFSILIKILMIPISIKQQKTMKKSTKIQAKMKEIQIKYKNNPEKLNEATMELYKSENMSPFSGCLSAIVQIILLFSVFYLVRSPLSYMKKVDSGIIDKYSKIIQQYQLSEKGAYPEIEIIRELDNIKNLKNKEKPNQENSAENQESENEEGNNENNEEKIALTEIKDEEVDELYINMDFFGLNLAQIPVGSKDWKAYIIPVLYVIVAFVSMRLTTIQTPKTTKENKEEKSLTKAEEDFNPMEQMNKNMNFIFPVLYVTVALMAPLGLALYWLMNSLLMIIEKMSLNKLLKDEEEN